MTSLFKRKYELVVGVPTVVKSGPIPYKTQVESGSEFVLTTHNISFSISKTNTPSNNTCEITIYNSSNDLVNYLQNNAGGSSFVKLSVAYGDQPLKELFIGAIQKMADEFTTTDRKTRLICSDGYANLKEKRTARSYRKGTTFSKIVDDMVKDLGLPKGTILPPDGELKASRSYNGPLRDIMTNIAKDINYNFSVQDGRVVMVPFNYSSGPNVKLISSSSGMIGSPSSLDTSAGQLKNNKESKKGVKVKVLIDAAVRPESFIVIESRAYNGTFKVNKINFSGEYEGSDWSMDIECEPVGSS